jgi:hypothetical protein
MPEIAGTGTMLRTYFPLEHVAGGNEAGEGAGPHPPTYCGVRTSGDPDIPGRWMYVRYDTGEEELYDLDADPWQLTSLDKDPAYDVQRSQLKELTEHLCDPTPPGFSWNDPLP